MSRRKKKKAAGWGEEYVELESETAALLQSIRKGPEKQIKKSTSMKNVKNVENVRSSPIRTGKKKTKSGGGTPKSKRTQQQRQRRRRASSSDRSDPYNDDDENDGYNLEDSMDTDSAPTDTFASLISTTVSSSFNGGGSRRGGGGGGSGSGRGGGGRRRKRPSNGGGGGGGSNVSMSSSSGRDTTMEASTGSTGSEEGEFEPPSSDRSESSSEQGTTPRQDDLSALSSAAAAAETPVQKEQRERVEALERARTEESRLRELSFRDEESRVREGLDGFVPHKVTQVAPAVKELDAEKERLNKVEAALNKRGKTRLNNLSNRDRRVAEMSAATDIQRMTRGRQGRKRALFKKKSDEMEADGITLLPPLHPELPGPDPTKYGPQPPDNRPKGSGSSNVDMDDQHYLLGTEQEGSDLILDGGAGENQKRLPRLQLMSKKKRASFPHQLNSARSDVSSISSISTASSDLDLDEAIPAERTPRLFLPDGSPDIKLRDTVRNALRVSRFDSVSTLLASGPLARKVKAGASKMKKRGVRQQQQQQGAVVDRVRDMHEPYRDSNGKQAGADKLVGNSKAPFKIGSDHNNKSGSGSILSPKKKKMKGNKDVGPPAMYEVSHGGFDTGERVEEESDETSSETASNAGSVVSKSGGRRKKRQVCFACWSAGDDMVKRCDMHEVDDNAPDDGRDDSILMCGNWNVHALRRRYRAEELQEVFAKAVSSLRWDMNRKQFVTVIECRHPIYRMINGLLETLQKRKSRMDHGKLFFPLLCFPFSCSSFFLFPSGGSSHFFLSSFFFFLSSFFFFLLPFSLFSSSAIMVQIYFGRFKVWKN